MDRNNKRIFIVATLGVALASASAFAQGDGASDATQVFQSAEAGNAVPLFLVPLPRARPSATIDAIVQNEREEAFLWDFASFVVGEHPKGETSDPAVRMIEEHRGAYKLACSEAEGIQLSLTTGASPEHPEAVWFDCKPSQGYICSRTRLVPANPGKTSVVPLLGADRFAPGASPFTIGDPAGANGCRLLYKGAEMSEASIKKAIDMAVPPPPPVYYDDGPHACCQGMGCSGFTGLPGC